MKNKQILTLILVTLVLASLACSLSGGGNSATEDAAAPEVPSQKETAPPEPSITSSPTQEELSHFFTDDHGVPMALVPVGPFAMGDDNARADSEKPTHTVILDAYYIDQYEVTNLRYAECVAVGACEPPSSNASATRDSYYDNADFAEYPVMFVSWNNAAAYCEWREARLPTEAEWEKAARGGLEGQQYPWGNKFDGTFANYCDSNCTFKRSDSDFDDGYIDTAPIGAYSPNDYGLYDMAGNLWEWTADWFDPNYYGNSPESNPAGSEDGGTRVVRGGSWESLSSTLRVAYRASNGASTTSDFIGFRCARDATP